MILPLNPQMRSKTGRYVTIGRITKPRGYRGDVRVLPLSDHPERFDRLQTIYVEDQNGDLRQLTVESVQRQPTYLIIGFVEVTTREEAEALRGCFLVVPPENVMSLPAGSFYVFDLIGMQVETEDGEIVGSLIDVEHYPANDIYIIDRGGQTVMIPAVREIVREINFQERRIRIVNRAGLLE